MRTAAHASRNTILINPKILTFSSLCGCIYFFFIYLISFCFIYIYVCTFSCPFFFPFSFRFVFFFLLFLSTSTYVRTLTGHVPATSRALRIRAQHTLGGRRERAYRYPPTNSCAPRTHAAARGQWE